MFCNEVKNDEVKNDEVKTDDLKDEQLLVFDKYIAGENIFITGPGGTGKTHIIKAIVKHATEKERVFKVCALTGCAAILLMCGAVTLHAFAGIGLATGTIAEVVEKVIKNRYKRPNWQKLDLLIVDEVSMLSLKIFRILDAIARKIKKKPNMPFGGIQIIFSGDFYQLPPVGDETDPESCQFCFESPLWDLVFPPRNQVQLKTMFRQTDPKYIKILNNIRVGKITPGTIATLTECVTKKYDTANEIRPTILLPRRRDAEIINNLELNKLDPKTEKVFQIVSVPETDLVLTKEQLKNLDVFTEKEREYELNYLTDNIIAEKTLKLRKGAIVMCIANLDVDSATPIVNGSQGIVTDFDYNGFPMVEFTNGAKQIITPHIWQSERMAGIAVKQVPLIYAWAITIHKAQGITLERALIDIGFQTFECGQTYVALSRIKSLAGLYLKSFDYTKITVNKKVTQFYAKNNSEK